eukprot:TRINITY_DN32067_c0_g1_i2.p1 TRINITY_DN32067_c0_g1~~TRINITY_DN32067_c0_g1_i2.p1  ORF type:complete len:1427 (-),score=416.49 TRINITY_DN32067_c0_g1_i2:162-4442(-)
MKEGPAEEEVSPPEGLPKGWTCFSETLPRKGKKAEVRIRFRCPEGKVFEQLEECIEEDAMRQMLQDAAVKAYRSKCGGKLKLATVEGWKGWTHEFVAPADSNLKQHRYEDPSGRVFSSLKEIEEHLGNAILEEPPAEPVSSATVTSTPRTVKSGGKEKQQKSSAESTDEAKASGKGKAATATTTGSTPDNVKTLPKETNPKLKTQGTQKQKTLQVVVTEKASSQGDASGDSGKQPSEGSSKSKSSSTNKAKKQSEEPSKDTSKPETNKESNHSANAADNAKQDTDNITATSTSTRTSTGNSKNSSKGSKGNSKSGAQSKDKEQDKGQGNNDNSNSTSIKQLLGASKKTCSGAVAAEPCTKEAESDESATADADIKAAPVKKQKKSGEASTKTPSKKSKGSPKQADEEDEASGNLPKSPAEPLDEAATTPQRPQTDGDKCSSGLLSAAKPESASIKRRRLQKGPEIRSEHLGDVKASSDDGSLQEVSETVKKQSKTDNGVKSQKTLTAFAKRLKSGSAEKAQVKSLDGDVSEKDAAVVPTVSEGTEESKTKKKGKVSKPAEASKKASEESLRSRKFFSSLAKKGSSASQCGTEEPTELADCSEQNGNDTTMAVESEDPDTPRKDVETDDAEDVILADSESVDAEAAKPSSPNKTSKRTIGLRDAFARAAKVPRQNSPDEGSARNVQSLDNAIVVPSSPGPVTEPPKATSNAIGKWLKSGSKATGLKSGCIPEPVKAAAPAKALAPLLNWAEKNAPTALKHLRPEKVWSQLRDWLKSWKPPGLDRTAKNKKHSTYLSAALVTGPPGSGKTAAVKMLASRERGHVIEYDFIDAEGRSFMENLAKKQRNGNQLPGNSVVLCNIADQLTQPQKDSLQQAVQASPSPVVLVAAEGVFNWKDNIVDHCLELKVVLKQQSITRLLQEVVKKESAELAPSACEAIAAACPPSDLRQAIATAQLLSVVPGGEGIHLPQSALSPPGACSQLLSPPVTSDTTTSSQSAASRTVEETLDLLALDEAVPSLVQWNSLCKLASLPFPCAQRQTATEEVTTYAGGDFRCLPTAAWKSLHARFMENADNSEEDSAQCLENEARPPPTDEELEALEACANVTSLLALSDAAAGMAQAAAARDGTMIDDYSASPAAGAPLLLNSVCHAVCDYSQKLSASFRKANADATCSADLDWLPGSAFQPRPPMPDPVCPVQFDQLLAMGTQMSLPKVWVMEQVTGWLQRYSNATTRVPKHFRRYLKGQVQTCFSHAKTTSQHREESNVKLDCSNPVGSDDEEEAVGEQAVLPEDAANEEAGLEEKVEAEDRDEAMDVDETFPEKTAECDEQDQDGQERPSKKVRLEDPDEASDPAVGEKRGAILKYFSKKPTVEENRGEKRKFSEEETEEPRAEKVRLASDLRCLPMGAWEVLHARFKEQAEQEQEQEKLP